MDKNAYKAIKGRIATAIRQDAAADQTVQDLLVETLAHAADTGDFTLLARLIGDCKTVGGEAFERGIRSRRLAIIEWTAAYSPIRVNGDGVIGSLKTTAKGYVAYDVTAATLNPFWTLKGEQDRRTVNRPFDLTTISGRLSGIGKAIDKQVEAGTLTTEDETVMRELSVLLNATFAKFVKAKGIDLDAIKAEREALKAPVPTVVDEPANDEPQANVGGKVVA